MKAPKRRRKKKKREESVRELPIQLPEKCKGKKKLADSRSKRPRAKRKLLIKFLPSSKERQR